MSSPRIADDTNEYRTAHLADQDVSMATGTSPEDMETDSPATNLPLETLLRMELLSQLFTLVLDIRNGKVLVRDFENNTGSVRLALANIRKLLLEVEGITETVDQRHKRIEKLQQSNDAKREVIRYLLTLTS